MKTYLRMDLDPEKILRERGLADGAARRFLAEEVRRRCDPYVPFDTGFLKGTARVRPDGSAVTYPAPYARDQFYTAYRHRDLRRGDHWHRRMLAAEGPALLRALSDYMKGETT